MEESTEVDEEKDERKEEDTTAKSRTLPWQCVGETGRRREKFRSETSLEKAEVLGF